MFSFGVSASAGAYPRSGLEDVCFSAGYGPFGDGVQGYMFSCRMGSIRGWGAGMHIFLPGGVHGPDRKTTRRSDYV